MERRVLMDATAPLDEPSGPDVPPTSPADAVQALAVSVPSHGDTIATATPVTFVRLAPSEPPDPPLRLSRATLSGAIWDEPPAGATDGARPDADLFRVQLTAGDVLDVDVDAYGFVFGDHTSVVDSMVRIFKVIETNPDTGAATFAKEVAWNDDADGFDPGLRYTVPETAAYYVGIAAVGYNYHPLVDPEETPTGQDAQQYRMTLTRATPGVDPTLTLGGSTGAETDAADQRVTWQAADADGDLVSVTATLFQNDFEVRTVSGVGDTGEVSFNDLGVGTFEVVVTATDSTGGTASATRSVVVTAAEGGRPVFSSLAVTDFTRENEEAVLVGVLDRPLARAGIVSLNWGDGTVDDVPMAAGETEIRATHRYLDDASEPAGTSVDEFLVTATLSDDRGVVAEASDSASVLNVAPAVTITAPDAGKVVAVGTPVTFRGKFADPGTLDTHTAVWEIDGTAMGMPVVRQAGEIAADRTVATTYAFTEPGVYTFRLTVADDDGGSHTVDTVTQAAGRFLGTVVVYDPSAGFVTGGGWIHSQAGAYRPNAAVEGKASFAFVSRYRSGEVAPSGQTEFAFRAAGLSFRSGSYEALVVSGSRARYRGTGALNGVGGYRFTMSLIDGQQADGGGQDRLRLRIWAPDSIGGGLVYDNNMGADDAADPATVIGGGSIVIHAK